MKQPGCHISRTPSRRTLSGTVYVWAVYGGVAILTSTAWGFATGEWKQADRAAQLWVLVGVMLFLIALAILAAKRQNSA